MSLLSIYIYPWYIKAFDVDRSSAIIENLFLEIAIGGATKLPIIVVFSQQTLEEKEKELMDLQKAVSDTSELARTKEDQLQRQLRELQNMWDKAGTGIGGSTSTTYHNTYTE